MTIYPYVLADSPDCKGSKAQKRKLLILGNCFFNLILPGKDSMRLGSHKGDLAKRSATHNGLFLSGI